MSKTAKKNKAPRILKLGDTVALIRPASRLDEASVKNAAKILREFGFCVVMYPHKLKSDRFFAASDEDRAKEIDWAFREPGISAVLSCRGGYGSMRALARIKPAQYQKWKTKLFVGYSDITYFHQWIQNQKQIISIHGPLTGRLPAAELKNFLRQLLKLPTQPSFEIWDEVRNIGQKKSAQGKLVGGNLSLLQTLGPARLPREPLILAIEDVNEDFYRLDRMLRTLIDAGLAPFVKGVVLGSLFQCGAGDSKSFGRDRLMATLKELTKGPIWIGARFGHGVRRQRLLPLGCRVRLLGKRFMTLDAVVKAN